MSDSEPVGYIRPWFDEPKTWEQQETAAFTAAGLDGASLDSGLELILAAMESEDPVKQSRVPLSEFGAVMPFIPCFFDQWDVPGFFRDVHPRDTGPIDISSMTTSEGDSICIQRTRTIDYRTLHKVGVKMLSRYAVRHDIGYLNLVTGKWDSDTLYSQFVGGEWRSQMTSRDQWENDKIAPNWKMRARPRYNRDEMSSIVMAHSMAFTMRYEWTVSMSLCGSMKIKIPTTPAGARAMFKDRDIEFGRNRRSALKNWVRKHSRMCLGGKVAEIPSHLRGRTPFAWNGFDCLLEPSPFDLELCRRNKAESAAKRLRGVA